MGASDWIKTNLGQSAISGDGQRLELDTRPSGGAE
jgi:hypothetical protein